MQTKKLCGFVVTFVATGGRSWSSLTVNFKVIKPEKLGYISIILYPDSAATGISFEPNFVTLRVSKDLKFRFLNKKKCLSQ